MSFSGRDQKLTLNADGTLTVDFMDRFSAKLFGSDGKLVGLDAGTVAGTLVIDLNDPRGPGGRRRPQRDDHQGPRHAHLR